MVFPCTNLFVEGVPNIVRFFLFKYEKASILQHSVDVYEQITQAHISLFDHKEENEDNIGD